MINKIIKSIGFLIYRNRKFYGLSVSKLGFVPKNHKLFQLAMLHRSASVKTKSGEILNYERLEFLGDAVLGAIIAEMLYKFFPNKDEGFLTKTRSRIVSRESLHKVALRLELNKAVISRSDISKNKNVYGDLFESLIGAIYLDQGLDVTKHFVDRIVFGGNMDIKDLVSVDTNYKSRLLEWGQKAKIDIVFDTMPLGGNKNRHFVCHLLINNQEYSSAIGSTKKEAEQGASKKALAILMSEDVV